MKFRLEFDSEHDDEETLKVYWHARDYYAALWEFSQRIRGYEKYGGGHEDVDWGIVQEEFYKVLADEGVTL